MNMRRVLLLGATGLVGRELLDLLLADESIETVRVIARRSTGRTSPRLEEHTFDLSEMPRRRELFAVDAIFCALGTTIRIAGSQERFRMIDHDYPVTAARLGVQNGAQHYLLVSAMGANENSMVFYNRVKGEVERDVLAQKYLRTTIARPSLLLGEREEFRLGERIFARLGPLMPPAWRPIAGRDVARALVTAAHEQTAPVQILESRDMRRG